MFTQIILLFSILTLNISRTFLKIPISRFELMFYVSVLTIILLSIYSFYGNGKDIRNVYNNFVKLKPIHKLFILLLANLNIITPLIVSKLYDNNSKFKINIIINLLRIITTIVVAYISTDNISKYIKLIWLGLIVYWIYFQKK